MKVTVGELGSSEYGGSKAAWISRALSRIPDRYPRIHGLLWLDAYADGMDWPIESSRSAAAAFARGIGDGAYAANAYGSIRSSPIEPPG